MKAKADTLKLLQAINTTATAQRASETENEYLLKEARKALRMVMYHHPNMRDYRYGANSGDTLVNLYEMLATNKRGEG